MCARIETPEYAFKSPSVICVYVYMCACMCLCMYMYVCVYIYVCICMYVCMYVCMYIYTFTYTHTETCMRIPFSAHAASLHCIIAAQRAPSVIHAHVYDMLQI